MPSATYTREDWLTPKQAADLMAVEVDRVHNMIKCGRLTTRSVNGGHRQVLRSEVLKIGQGKVTPARIPVS
jgi:excisionase family DNA binding protein